MAATVSKSSKINFYKFVQVKDPSSADAKKPGAAQEGKIALALNSNTRAVNNLGATVNSLAKVLTDLKKVAIIDLEREQKRQSSFTAKFAKEKQERSKPLVSGILGAAKTKGFLEAMLGALSGLFKYFVGTKVLEWLSDPENKKMIEDGLEIIGKIGKFIWDWAKFSVVSTIDGLYDLFSDDTTWWEKTIGFGKALVGIGSAILLIRYLSNPTKIITDITRGVRALIGFVTGGGRRPRGPGGPSGPRRRNRLGGAARFLTGAVVTGAAGYGLYQSFQEPEYAQGGKVKKKAAGGGWINGPMSGYPVSLDGGRSTAFIGHGREYVAQKAGGGAFVVPFNTPATQRMSGLTGQRIAEARKGGYKLPGFSGGGAYLNEVKSRDGTTGSNDNKKIFLHWSAGPLDGTNVYEGKYGYHSYLTTSGLVNKSKYGSSWPAHTYNRNGSYAAALGIAGGANNTEYGTNWGRNAPKMSQYQRMAKEAGALAANWGWKESDINDKRVRTHYEEYRDYPNWYHRDNPNHYRWDLRKLMPGDALGSGPNKIRNMIKAEYRKFKGGTSNQNSHDDSNFPLGGFGRALAGAADALTGNRWDLDKRGGQSPQPSSGNTDSSGGDSGGGGNATYAPLPLNMTKKQAFATIYELAKKHGSPFPELTAAQAMFESAYLTSALARMDNNPFGQTGTGTAGSINDGKRTWARYNSLDDAVKQHVIYWDKDYKGNKGFGSYPTPMAGLRALLPTYAPESDGNNHKNYMTAVASIMSTMGFDPNKKNPLADLSSAKLIQQRGALGGGSIDVPGSAAQTGSGRTGSDSSGSQAMDREELKLQNLSNLLGMHSTRGINGEFYTPPGVGISPGESLDANLNQATQDRMTAQNEMVNGTTQTMQQIVSVVTNNNANVGAAVQEATQAVSTLTKGGGEETPTIVGAGVDLIKSTASLLNSFNNPLKGILK